MKNITEEQIDKALDIIENYYGIKDKKWDHLAVDIDDSSNGETCFKTMSKSGKKDNEFAEKIKKLFKEKKIKYKHGLQKRVFILKTKELLKLVKES